MRLSKVDDLTIIYSNISKTQDFTQLQNVLSGAKRPGHMMIGLELPSRPIITKRQLSLCSNQGRKNSKNALRKVGSMASRLLFLYTGVFFNEDVVDFCTL